MKPKTLLIVVAAGILFLTSQFFIVRQIWKQKDEVFKLKYRSGSQEAIDNMMVKSGDSGFDYAYVMIDYVSRLHLNNVKLLSSPQDSAKFKSKVRENITSILLEDEALSRYLRNYFDKLGLDKEFNHKIFVNDLYLIDYFSNYHIYKAPESEMKRQGDNGLVHVNTFFSEGNNFKVSFDYYIDVTNKKKIILREISLILTLSLLSLLILTALFWATLRNYLEEKRLSNLKTDFINNMTHELKTPLSTITVAGKTLKLEEILDNRQMIVDTANLIGKQSVHLNRLINLILEISMWERSQFEIEKKECDVEEILRDIAITFRNGCGSECSFTESYDLKGIKAGIDLVYFTTMVNNLLNNAVKYSGDEPSVRIKAWYDGLLKIEIADRGIGISRSDQKHIFEKFYRVSTGNIHKTKGLGLGLYYVKRIAEAHGGDVTVSSKPGKGSVFTVILPLK